MILCGYGYDGPKAPCTKDCSGRTPVCHGRCAAYREYEKKRHAYLAQLQKEKHGIPDKKLKEVGMF